MAYRGRKRVHRVQGKIFIAFHRTVVLVVVEVGEAGAVGFVPDCPIMEREWVIEAFARQYLMVAVMKRAVFRKRVKEKTNESSCTFE
jgi:hypothetical protein